MSLFRPLQPARVTVWLVVVTTLLHLAVAGGVAFGVDEAHYALYGLKLDLSYFDHPPMVGWLQALILPFSEQEWALRLWPILLAAAASALLFRLTRVLFPDGSPWLATVAVALLQSAVIFQLIAVGLVPEGPLLLFALAAALTLYRAVEEGRGRHWLLTGLLFGLAGLSKYTAVTLVVTAVLFIALRGRWRVLASPWPWVAALVALVVVMPVLWWNAGNDWLSFRYQLGHGAPDRTWEITRFLRSQAAQLLVYGPLLYGLGAWAAFSAIRQRANPGVALALALTAPVLLLFGWGAGFEETLPHWTLLGWAALAPLAAHLIVTRWHERRWVRGAVYAGGTFGLILIAVVHTQLLHPWLPFTPHRHPMGDLYGWREAAQHAASLYDEIAAEGEGTPALFVGNWSIASRIAWYARPRPVQVTDTRFDQFDLWYGSPQPGAGGVLIVPENYQARPQVSGLAKFSHCERVDTLPVILSGKPVHTFEFYRCKGFHG